MPAAGEPEILPRDANPLEVLRGGEHPLDQLLLTFLEPPPLDESPAGLGNAIGEIVAQGLQLTEVE